MRLESEYGIPCVAVHVGSFSRLVAASTRANGMPRTRQAFVPQPFADQTPARLRAYIESDDPVNGRPFARQVIDGLMVPLDEQDMKGVTFERSMPRLLDHDSEENLQRQFLESSWTDKLPIVLPAEERVEAMLKGTSRRPDEVVGVLRPTAYREFWQFTVEQVAVNAVMAGARPEYLPVILALLASGVTARPSGTSSMAAMVVVNGPIRLELEMNSGIGALGPYNHANATIGRAYGLASQNLQGGSIPGVTYMGSRGNNFAYTSMTFAENEERCPWEPLHVRHGFDPDVSTATIFKNCHSLISTQGFRETWQERMKSMVCALENTNGAVFLLDPIVANALLERGLDTPAKLAEWVHRNAHKPAREWWDGPDAQESWAPGAEDGVEPWATYLSAGPDDPIPMFQPEDIEVVVVGGETLPVWSVVNALADGLPRAGIDNGAIVSIDKWR